MKRHFYFLLVMLATGLVGCNITIKPDPNSVTTNVDSVEVSVNVNVYGDSVAAQPVDLSQCDMVMLDNGKLHFYDTKTATSIPYVAETDSVVNCVGTMILGKRQNPSISLMTRKKWGKTTNM